MIAPEVLQSERLLLVPLRPDDADDAYAALHDERLHDFIGGHPLSHEQLRERYRRLAQGGSPDGLQRWLNWTVRLRSSHAFVGTVQATIVAEVAQVAWVVASNWQRQGIATEAAAAMLSWLDRREIFEVRANIHPLHTASQNVAMRIGLKPTGDVIHGEQVWLRRRPTPPNTTR